MALDFEKLKAQVAETVTAQGSAVTLLHHLTNELQEISAKLAATPPMEPVDTAPLDELVEKLKTSTDALAAAVVESTGVSDAPASMDANH